jgi:hypothetical protein
MYFLEKKFIDGEGAVGSRGVEGSFFSPLPSRERQANVFLEKKFIDGKGAVGSRGVEGRFFSPLPLRES